MNPQMLQWLLSQLGGQGGAAAGGQQQIQGPQVTNASQLDGPNWSPPSSGSTSPGGQAISGGGAGAVGSPTPPTGGYDPFSGQPPTPPSWNPQTQQGAAGNIISQAPAGADQSLNQGSFMQRLIHGIRTAQAAQGGGLGGTLARGVSGGWAPAGGQANGQSPAGGQAMTPIGTTTGGQTQTSGVLRQLGGLGLSPSIQQQIAQILRSNGIN
jgi:hypothetical protein